jgi:Fe-S-cluster containining protein
LDEWGTLVRYSSVQETVFYDQPYPDLPEVIRVANRAGHCPFLSGSRCSVYEIRPAVCRMYGQHWSMRCKAGVECPTECDMTDEEMAEIANRFGITGTMDGGEFQQRKREAVERMRARGDIAPDEIPSITALLAEMGER